MYPTIYNCTLIYFNKIGDRLGKITPINNNIDIPFNVKRIFYLYDVPSAESRGAHAHKECHQVLIAASGAFEVLVDDGTSKRLFQLNQPNVGLHIPPGIWASEINFSGGAICLVLASEAYDEKDYIRDYKTYIENK
jgi:hypothetical protein